MPLFFSVYVYRSSLTNLGKMSAGSEIRDYLSQESPFYSDPNNTSNMTGGRTNYGQDSLVAQRNYKPTFSTPTAVSSMQYNFD